MRRWQCSIIWRPSWKIYSGAFSIYQFFFILIFCFKFGFLTRILFLNISFYNSFDRRCQSRKWFPVFAPCVGVHTRTYICTLVLLNLPSSRWSKLIFEQLICKHLIIILDRISATKKNKNAERRFIEWMNGGHCCVCKPTTKKNLLPKCWNVEEIELNWMAWENLHPLSSSLVFFFWGCNLFFFGTFLSVFARRDDRCEIEKISVNFFCVRGGRQNNQ